MKKIVFLMAVLFAVSAVSYAAKKKVVPEKKRAAMWIDGEANFARFSNPDSIDYYVTNSNRWVLPTWL